MADRAGKPGWLQATLGTCGIAVMWWYSWVTWAIRQPSKQTHAGKIWGNAQLVYQLVGHARGCVGTRLVERVAVSGEGWTKRDLGGLRRLPREQG